MANKLMKTWSPIPGLVYEICDATARDSIQKIEQRESNYFTSSDVDTTLKIGGKPADAMIVGTALTGKLSLDGSLPMMGSLNMNTYGILNIKEPTINKDVTTKLYVDTLVKDTKEEIENKYNEVYNNVKLKTYSNPTQFGCTANSTPENILNILPNNSIFVCLPEELTNTNWNFPEAIVSGYILQITKVGAVIEETETNRVSVELLSLCTQDGNYQGVISVSTDGTNTYEWTKVPRMYSYTVTLGASTWEDHLQPVVAKCVLADETKCQVIVSPAFSTLSEYTNANIQCVAQENDALMFMCEFLPSSDILVNVLVFV